MKEKPISRVGESTLAREFQAGIEVCAGELNRQIQAGESAAVVQVSEAQQERQIKQIADEITRRFDLGMRIVLIAGPSSSGKTTLCKRLQILLDANGLQPVSISLDDYYVNREDTPLDETGKYDYESLYAIDLKSFNSDLKKLLSGEEIALPTYDFQTGRRVYKGNTIRLSERSVLIMEGIHGMNPLLIPEIPATQVYKIYIWAQLMLSFENQNGISTTDNRLIRRMTRDYQFRGYSAKATLEHWPAVRKGEDRWIFPHRSHADVLFNSALKYELSALRRIAEPILQEVASNEAEYAEAQRLLELLLHFYPIDMECLPPTSLLREFVGKSAFHY